MFKAKAPKSEQPDKTNYTLYHPHTLGPEERKAPTDYYQVISIDPAQKNLALRIERRYIKTRKIETIVFDKVDITDTLGQDAAEYIDNRYDNLTDFLDKYKDHYSDTHILVMERQLAINYRSVRISQHIITYFLLCLRDAKHLPYIVEINPQIKTRQLGAEKGLNKLQIKKWAVAKARLLLTWRNDTKALAIMDKFKRKQDDLADTVCQIEALFSLWNLPLTEEPKPFTRINIIATEETKKAVTTKESQTVKKRVIKIT